MIPPLSHRLDWCMKVGNLTVADLARWFDRPDPTVRVWVNGGRLGGAPLDRQRILDALERLEHKIKRRQGFPVPPLTPTHRIRYLKRIMSG